MNHFELFFAYEFTEIEQIILNNVDDRKGTAFNGNLTLTNYVVLVSMTISVVHEDETTLECHMDFSTAHTHFHIL